MTFQFTSPMVAELNSRLTTANSSGNYQPVYQYIFDQITSSNYTDPDTGLQYPDGPRAGVDKSVWLWVRGAKSVNANDNSFFSD